MRIHFQKIVQFVITFLCFICDYYYFLFIMTSSILNVFALKYSLGKGCLKVENEVTVK